MAAQQVTHRGPEAVVRRDEPPAWGGAAQVEIPERPQRTGLGALAKRQGRDEAPALPLARPRDGQAVLVKLVVRRVPRSRATSCSGDRFAP